MKKEQRELIVAEIDRVMKELEYVDPDQDEYVKLLQRVEQLNQILDSKKTPKWVELGVGIAGSIITALIGGAFYMHGLNKGFRFEQTGSVSSGFFRSFINKGPKT